jgi:hypothetical protein
MKRLVMLLCSFSLFFCMAVVAYGAPFTYHDAVIQPHIVTSSGTIPRYWVQLGFPASSQGTYGNGIFEYDNYINQVNSFQITLYGHSNNSNSPIDIYLDFDSNHQSYSPLIASYSPPAQLHVPFTLALDIANNALLYNNVSVGNLSNVNLQSFVGYNSFWVGYACYFVHDKTTVDVSVPEPATLFLLGSSLIGIALFAKKFRK